MDEDRAGTHPTRRGGQALDEDPSILAELSRLCDPDKHAEPLFLCPVLSRVAADPERNTVWSYPWSKDHDAEVVCPFSCCRVTYGNRNPQEVSVIRSTETKTKRLDDWLATASPFQVTETPRHLWVWDRGSVMVLVVSSSPKGAFTACGHSPMKLSQGQTLTHRGSHTSSSVNCVYTKG